MTNRRAKYCATFKPEIGAGKVLIPRTPEELAHNNACDRANAIIQNYRDGIGLFQMTREIAAKRGGKTE